MSTSLPADFLAICSDFEAKANKAKMLEEYEAAPQKRKEQLVELSPTTYKLLGYPSQLLHPDSKGLVELLFEMRKFYHDLYHPDKSVKPSYPDDYDGLRQVTRLTQEEREKIQEETKKKARKVPKSKETVDTDDDLEIITGNEVQTSKPSESDQGLVKALTKSFNQMQVDDEDKPEHEIGTVPKGLHFKKVKTGHEWTCQVDQKSNAKKRKHLPEYDDSTFISAGVGPWPLDGHNISQFPEEAKLITNMPSDLPNTVPALKKRLYQYMIEIAVINDRIRADIMLRSSHVEDAAKLAERMAELDGNAEQEASSSNQ
ncbi:hypothetical protein R3P38DRAFT_2778630 [Favolaschia claudopus]|uniref:Uncharacterized protein n=1 Tax=Favolaschia claudopus TaxID=2862362 RepID=A0AAW0BJQ5_9AGAR